jgi:hypothetical protein
MDTVAILSMYLHTGEHVIDTLTCQDPFSEHINAALVFPFEKEYPTLHFIKATLPKCVEFLGMYVVSSLLLIDNRRRPQSIRYNLIMKFIKYDKVFFNMYKYLMEYKNSKYRTYS